MRLISTLVLALLMFAVSGNAEDYQCTVSAGCEASITEDGELVTVDFRKGDIVNTDAGWVVHQDDGWVKVRSKRDPDPKPRNGGTHDADGGQQDLQTTPRFPVYRPGFEGISVTVPGVGGLTYVGSPTWAINGDGHPVIVLRVNWQHEDSSGFVRNVNIDAEYHPDGNAATTPAQEIGAVVAGLVGVVNESAAWYPPNYTPPQPFVSSNKRTVPWGGLPPRVINVLIDDGIVSLPIDDGGQSSPPSRMTTSWQHDLDGDGPLQPISVTAEANRQPGDSYASMARRLARATAALSQELPPNVETPAPTNPGGG